MKVIETVGKDIEEALKKGLAELDCRLDDVEVKILEHPGIFRKARVQFTYEGRDGRADIKTKSDIMRNLERRAAKDAMRDGRDAKKRQEPDRKGKPGGEQRVGSDGADKRPAPAARETNGSDGRKPAADAGERKNEFRSDFRVGLKAASAEPRPAKENKQARPDECKNDRRHTESFTAEELDAAAKRADSYLDKVVTLMNVKAERVCSVADGEVNIELKTDDAAVIGHRGETLDALEYLATLAASAGDDKFVHVNLDCGGYRAKRNEALIESAVAAAEKAVATGKRVELEPMGSVSRRTVHAVLANRSDVITKSEGRDPNRYIVVIPRSAGGAHGNRGKNNRKRHKNGNRGQNRERGEKTE